MGRKSVHSGREGEQVFDLALRGDDFIVIANHAQYKPLSKGGGFWAGKGPLDRTVIHRTGWATLFEIKVFSQAVNQTTTAHRYHQYQQMQRAHKLGIRAFYFTCWAAPDEVRLFDVTQVDAAYGKLCFVREKGTLLAPFSKLEKIAVSLRMLCTPIIKTNKNHEKNQT